MDRKDGKEGFWLSENSDKRRLRDAENARKNRAEITKALAHGQVSRRDLVRWGLFSAAGILAPIGGLSPYARAQTTSSFSSFGGGSTSTCGRGFNDGGGGTNNNGIPIGLPPSPTFGVQPFTQAMPRFDVLARNAV